MRRFIDLALISTVTLFALPLQSANRIVGGTEITDSRYPWMAAISYRNGSDRFQHRCGGALISDRWKLSAAHCFVASESGLQSNPHDIACQLDTLDLFSYDGIFEIASRFIVQPDYEPGSPLHDIALVELPSLVDLEPITIPGQVNIPQNGENSIVAGWGNTSEGGEGSA